MKSRVIKSASIAFMLTVATLSANAQRPAGGNQQREKLSAEKIAEIKTDKLDQVLELTDKQESKIYDIILNCAKTRPERAERPERGERAERGADREQNREAMAEQREQMQKQREQQQQQQLATTKAIMAQLNDDQKIEYAMYLSREHGPRQPREGRGQEKRDGQGGQGRQGGQGCQDGQGCPQGQDAPRAPRN